GIWMLGPLGRGFTAPPSGRRAILVGGGVGIAPLAMLQDGLERGATVLLGFRDGARAEGAALLAGATVATDDGSVGHHGLVPELLRPGARTPDRQRLGDLRCDRRQPGLRRGSSRCLSVRRLRLEDDHAGAP